MIRIFAGYDERERKGYETFCASVKQYASQPFEINRVSGDQRDGTNAFTYARFVIPQLCGYQGWALFMDGSDMLMRADVAELWALRDENYAVQIVKHDYKTKHSRKYIGTEMEADNRDYPRKNWSSLVLWNCAHLENKRITEKFVRFAGGAFLHRFAWLADDLIGSLPLEWNYLVGEYPYNEAAKVAHFTLGIPSFPHYQNCDYSNEWFGVDSTVEIAA